MQNLYIEFKNNPLRILLTVFFSKHIQGFQSRVVLSAIGIALLIGACFAPYAKASGASLYLSPATGSYSIGKSFSIKVKVDSGGIAINAADGVLNFDPNKLQILGVSKANSIFSLWVKEPTFSSSAGSISFGGGMPNNFVGSAGTIFTVNFKAKSSGIAKVNFISGSVLAADGKGTNILSAFYSGAYNISPAVVAPIAGENNVPPNGAPPAPSISSPTHPNPEKWYSNNSPVFTWIISEDITGVKLLVDRSPISIPTVFYSEPISEKRLENLSDGIWYFHVQLKNKYGWGGVSHFKFKIDTTPPNPFKIGIEEGSETTNPRPTLHFRTTDEMSGVDHYLVKIGVGDIFPVFASEVKHNPFQMPIQAPGKHSILVGAVDKAGNETFAMTEVRILPIEAPTITKYPKELRPNSFVSIGGTALSDATVKIFIQKDKGEIKTEEIKSNKDGNWRYIGVEPLKSGVYKVWAQTIDESGAVSTESKRIEIFVRPPTFIRIGKIAVDYLTTIVILFALVFALISIIFWILERMGKRKKKLEKKVGEAGKSLYESFNVLRREVEKQVAKLDGKEGLSRREKEICEKLKKALAASEKLAGKKIKDIGKELKK